MPRPHTMGRPVTPFTPRSGRRGSASSSGSIRSGISALVNALSTPTARSLGWTAAEQARTALKKTKSLPFTPARRYTRKLAGTSEKVPFKKGSKVKKFNAKKVVGVSRKFTAKVRKVVDHDASYGHYDSWGERQLRQTALDRWAVFAQNQSGLEFAMGTWGQVKDAANVLYLGKAIDPNWKNVADATRDIGDRTKVRVKSQSMEFFFKSTSSHTVNIQMWECTYKKPTADGPETLAAESFNDYLTSIRVPGGGPIAMDMTFNGLTPKLMPTLQEYCDVKVHRIKLLPGSYTSYTKKLPARTYDPTFMSSDANLIPAFTKGSVAYFFRVQNDITVSGGSTDRIHAWESSEIGGVAMRYKRTMILRPPDFNGLQDLNNPNIMYKGNVFKSQLGYFARGLESDQQVSYYNPTSSGGLG